MKTALKSFTEGKTFFFFLHSYLYSLSAAYKNVSIKSSEMNGRNFICFFLLKWKWNFVNPFLPFIAFSLLARSFSLASISGFMTQFFMQFRVKQEQQQ